MRFMKHIRFLFLFSVPAVVWASGAEAETFPIPSGMEGHVAFWESIFTVYSTNQIVIHDSDHAQRIYSVLQVDPEAPGKHVRSQVRQECRRIRGLLQQLARNPDPARLSGEDERIRALFGEHPKPNDFKRAATRIRIQSGMRETFQAGLERSGRYLEDMKRILRQENVPEDLVYLPHVESSFNPLARSKAGAAGIWQFTYGTGKRVLSIRPQSDERRDPLASTRAAARLLRSNYDILKTWPLAVTAYNHGPAGVRRAVRVAGSRDLGRIVRTYRSRRFGFASKNFYAEFLAARRIALEAEAYFPGLFYDPPFQVRAVTLTQPMFFSLWAESSEWPREVLAEINPALSSSVLLDRTAIPAGTKLNVPAGKEAGQRIALATGTSIFWASRTNSGLERPAFRLSSTVAYSVKTQVAVFNPARYDSIGNALLRQPFDSGSVQDLIAFTDTQDSADGSPGTEPHMNISEALYSKPPKFDLNLAVRSGDRIAVQPEETLGHFADWLGVPTWKLRRLNRLRYGQKIRLGQTIRLTFDRVSEDVFSARRKAYHQEIRAHFFLTHQISEVRAHVIRPGENFWTVANDSDNVPLWLMLAYNSGHPVQRLKPGDRLRVPVVSPKPTSG